MTIPAWLPSVKVIKCKVCLEDVKVNASYPITEVTCTECYKRLKNNRNV